MMRRRVFRFAPSPNGYLHRGHAFSALLNRRAAEATGGRFLLRIEDIDATRARQEFEAAIYEDLAWLGLAWEEPVLRQSERFDAYRDSAGRTRTARPALSRRSSPAPRSPQGGGGRTGLAARPGRRAALSRRGAQLVRHRGGRRRWRAAGPMRSASTWRGRWKGARRCPGSERDPFGVEPPKCACRRSRRLGRCRAGAQGGAGKLPPRGRRGRRLPGRHGRGARQGSRSRDVDASSAAGDSRPAPAALFPSPADPRRGRPQAFQVARLGDDTRAPRRGRKLPPS